VDNLVFLAPLHPVEVVQAEMLRFHRLIPLRGHPAPSAIDLSPLRTCIQSAQL